MLSYCSKAVTNVCIQMLLNVIVLIKSQNSVLSVTTEEKKLSNIFLVCDVILNTAVITILKMEIE